MLFRAVKFIVFGTFGVLLFSCSSLMHRLLNATQLKPPFRPSRKAWQTHKELFVADLHADTLLWDRDIILKSSYGHVDIPRMIEGNIGLQVFSAVTHLPLNFSLSSNSEKPDSITLLTRSQKWPSSTRNSYLERALYQARKLADIAAASSGVLMMIRTRRDLKELLSLRKDGHPVIGALLSLEGAQTLEGKLTNLDRLYDAGFRMIGLSHFIDTKIAGSAHGKEKYGLTELGREMIRQAAEKGMVIDLAHASPKTIDDTLAVVQQPVMVSHTGVRGVCDTVRNLSDEHVRAVAENGGVVGIGLFKYATCGKTVEDTVKAMRYVTDLVGIDHVALGSDFDGAKTVFDASGLPLLTEALMKNGFSLKEIRGIMGENVLRVLSQTLPD